ncbi:MAG: glucose-1-phosphate cytidylyltransferase [Rhodospirillales bacterium]
MKTVILCGGKGTRIRDVADNIPKPMIPVGEKPILWHIMKYYAHAGFKDFVLCLGHQGGVIRDFFMNYQAHISDIAVDFSKGGAVEYLDNHEHIDWRVTLAETGLDTLTGSRLKRVERYIGGDEHFMLTYGDGVGDVDLKALVNFHKSTDAVLTVSGVRPPGRFGEILDDGNGIVMEFNEKPQATGGRISGGFFVCRREVFDYLDADREDEILEREPMRKIAREGKMAMFAHDGFWQCMDTTRDYALLNEMADAGKAPWIVW